MTAEALPYRLRPHKAVDRRLFLDLLSRWERWQPLDRHVYVSMAGYTMEDQKLVHRLVGIDRLLAFDRNSDIVDRQMFNRPTHEARCVVASADEITADIDLAVRSAGIDDASGYVVWLDYTSPAQIGEQLREFRTLAAQLAPGDIVRVTVNAAPQSWGRQRRDDDRVEGQELREVLRGRIYEMLRTRLGDALAPEIEPNMLDDEGLASALARAFGISANRAVRPTSGRRLVPLSIVRYADGLQMLSITAALVEDANIGAMRERLGLDAWPFSVSEWSDVRFIAVPDLTIRERLYLERNTHRTSAEIAEDVGFDFDGTTGMPDFLENYRSYYRHYPALSPVEL